jgi:UDP-N-acetylmuramoylalanine--D-glutamate ligase
MGLGRFGGGLGVTRWLLNQGAQVLLTDIATESELESQLRELGTHPKLSCVFGEHRRKDFLDTDVVIANPAIPRPWENPYLKAAWEEGVCVTTEIELALQQIDRRQVVGVTGTSGKSTTCAMIHAALVASGFLTHIGGNIGGSMLSIIDTIEETDIVVLELSSAMLWWISRNSNWSPHIAVLTNIEENHIDWHGSFEEYVRCKELLFANQKEGDISITQDSKSTFEGLAVIGEHNERNAAVAFLAANAVGADSSRSRVGIQKFCGLPHRLQLVCKGIYNDSKSTTPIATKLAIDAFPDTSKIHVIVGGYDKKVDLTLLAKQANRVGGMYAIGETANEILAIAGQVIQVCHTLDCAVEKALNSMNSEDVLLLSPGCASWDQFENYEQRGEQFCNLVTAPTPQRGH